MKNTLLITLICWWGITGLSAQICDFDVFNESLQNLQQALEESISDSCRVEVLNEIAFDQRDEDRTLARESAEEAKQISLKINYKKGLGDAYTRLGTLDDKEFRLDAAITHFSSAIRIRTELGDTLGVAGLYNNLGKVILKAGNIAAAVDTFRVGIALIKDHPSHRNRALLYNNLGNAYRYLGERQQAVICLDSSLHIYQRLNKAKGQANVYLDLGNLYLDFRDPIAAKKNFEKSLAIYKDLKLLAGQAKCWIGIGNLYYQMEQYDQAVDSYKAAQKLDVDLPPKLYAILKKNMGNILRQREQFEPALDNYFDALHFFQQQDSPSEIAPLHYNIGLVYEDLENYSKAKEHYDRCLNILEEIEVDPKFQSSVLYRLAGVEAQIGDYEMAFQYSTESSQLWDSMNNNLLQAVQLQNRLVEAENLNKQLTLENKLQKTKTMNYLIIFASMVILLAILCALVYSIYRQRQKSQQVDHLLLDQENKVNYARLEGQDEERKRIAQDLHDRLGSTLSTVKLYFSALDSKIDVMRLENREQYRKANALLDDACEEVRRVAHNMQSGILTKFGLAAQLKSLAATIENSNQIEVEVTTHKLEERLDSMTEVNIYRIIQELVSNALKHSGATRLSLQLSQFEDMIHILVEDNGVGFDLETAKSKGGMGLKNLQSRVSDLKGELHFDSQKGRGTTVSIDIPTKSLKGKTIQI